MNQKLFGLASNDEPKKEEVKVNHFNDSTNTYQEEDIEDDDTDLEEEPEDELSEQEKKMMERERRMQAVLQEPTYHVFDDHDNTPQGQKAIQLGIQNKQNGKKNYDYTKADGADFAWPDYKPEQIGHLEP